MSDEFEEVIEEAEETPVPEAPESPTLLGEQEESQEDDTGKLSDNDAQRAGLNKAPEEYEQFSLPEGVELDSETVEMFLPIARDLDLTQEQAQKLVDLYTMKQTETFKSFADAWQDTQERWVDSARQDPEYGRAQFDKNLKIANAFLSKYGNAELVEALQDTGMGNHPELIRAFVKAGKDLAEDELKFGHEREAPRDPASILFPNQGKE